jgi:hypothetical protein
MEKLVTTRSWKRPLGRVSAVATAVLIALPALGSLPAGATGGIPAPAIVVTPSTHLGDHADVTIVASGFSPGNELGNAQCALVEQGEWVCHNEKVFIQTDAAGGGQAVLPVHRVVDMYRTDHSLWGTVDCGAADQVCGIATVNSNDPNQFAGASLTFD